MKKFNLENNIERVLRGENSYFLNPNDLKYVTNSLKKLNFKYQVFKLYEESEKMIVYKDKLNISLFEIKSKDILTHKQILGSLFSHNLKEEVFGDIIISDKYYIVVLNQLKKYMVNNFNKVGNIKIELIERDLSLVKTFKPSYLDINLNVSSLRIDNIISKLVPTSRSISRTIINDQRVMVNYQILKNNNYLLKENDIFSIRGIGKFRFVLVNQINRSGKINILIKKYV